MENVIVEKNLLELKGITPEPKVSRLRWDIEEMSADRIKDIDVRMSRRKEPYFVLSFENGVKGVSVMVGQLLADQEGSDTTFVVSKPGEPLKVDRDVMLGITDGEFYFHRKLRASAFLKNCAKGLRRNFLYYSVVFKNL